MIFKLRSQNSWPVMIGCAGLLLLSPAAHASQGDTTVQLWTNMMYEWQATPSWLVTVDVEPKVLLVGPGQWRALDVTTSAKLATTTWLDVLGELGTGYTNDAENPDVGELTPRLGARFYLLRSRLQLLDNWRIEMRNRIYDDGTGDHLFRTRNRVELQYVLNRQRANEPGAVILLADFEYFVPIVRDVRERYASRYRIRGGVGYRLDERWRIDLLYFFQQSRNTEAAPFDQTDHIIDVRFRYAF